MPAVLTDAGKNDVLLQHLVAAESIAPRSKDVNFGRADHIEEDGPELPEVWARGEAAGSDENEIAALAQERGADGHEESVDVRLPVNHCGSGQRPRVGLADLEVRRIGDNDVEVFQYRAGGEKLAEQMQCLGVRQDEIGSLDMHRDLHSLALDTPVDEIGEDGP